LKGEGKNFGKGDPLDSFKKGGVSREEKKFHPSRRKRKSFVDPSTLKKDSFSAVPPQKGGESWEKGDVPLSSGRKNPS